MPRPVPLLPGHGFLNGTRILAIVGELPAERLGAGMQVLTLSGEGAPLKPVLEVLTGRLDEAGEVVRILAGAIEDGVPIRDLVVLPDHGIGLDDSFGRRRSVPARLLVNGATVRREPARRAAFVQVMLEGHELLMAEGMPAESRPCGEDGLVQLRGKELAAVHARLLERAPGRGWELTADPALSVLADGAPLVAAPRQAAVAEGRHAFEIPAGCAFVQLVSRNFVPAHTEREGGDERRLGIAVERIVHDGTELDLAGPACGAGFLPVEGEPRRCWRWTSGEAWLNLPTYDRPTVLELWLARGWSRYWLARAG